MGYRCLWGCAVLTGALVSPGLALGRHHSESHQQANGRGPSHTVGQQTKFPGYAVGGGWGWYGPPYFATIGQNGPMIFGPGWNFFPPPPGPGFVVDRGELGGPMPRVGQGQGQGAAARPRRVDSAKAGQLVTIGDRLFRGGNLKRAVERYEQAVKADPGEATARVRLAQVALVRGRFGEAANFLREGVAAEPAWLMNAGDIQTIYGEPSDFARQIARLEARVQTEPGDRDAWLVLGAQLYLSGQTRRAYDVFVRLTDRAPDSTLEAFLKASRPGSIAAK